jgi:hypothetical protein
VNGPSFDSSFLAAGAYENWEDQHRSFTLIDCNGKQQRIQDSVQIPLPAEAAAPDRLHRLDGRLDALPALIRERDAW